MSEQTAHPPLFKTNQSGSVAFGPGAELTPGGVNYASLSCCQCVHNGGPSFGLVTTTAFIPRSV